MSKPILLQTIKEKAPIYSPVVTISSTTTINDYSTGKIYLCNTSSNITITLGHIDSTNIDNPIELEIINCGSGTVEITTQDLNIDWPKEVKSITLESGNAIALKYYNLSWYIIGTYK